MTRPTGAYAWLNAEPGPRMLQEALALYGVLEAPGAADNPQILAWADEMAQLGTGYAKWAGGWYADDGIPWCGLFMGVVAKRANVAGRADRAPPEKYLSAAEWSKFGVGVPIGQAMLGDVLVFVRSGGGHVALYVGEDAGAFHVLGGNQADKVCIIRIDKRRATACRRVPYLNPPPNLRKVRLATGGALSTNEA